VRSLLVSAALVLVLAALVPLPHAEAKRGQRSGTVEVVVTLASAPLAYSRVGGRAAAERRIEREQRRFVDALRERVPAAVTRWRYRTVANGVAVVVPESELDELRRLPGVRDVARGTSYGAALDDSPRRIGAPALWGPDLAGAGQGVKIGIIDDGVDQTHPFFDPKGYVMPPGFPKGRRSFTTAKVIVARAFPPPGASWKHAAAPFDPVLSAHGTHVAGIAAGNHRTRTDEGRRISGVAPRAYIGNYKALTVPTDADVGLNGNAPELVAAIEAAVADGMDVINLSLGEPEIEPARDVVARALDAAAAAGVVPVVAAGNDHEEFGAGSVSSPGSAARAITVAAAELTPSGAQIASFSARGPTTLSLRMKPDVTAPGVDILSSVPGGYATGSGTSMAAPHVAGGAALLVQRHPEWTVDQVKSALVSTARPLERTAPGKPTRVGTGLLDLAAADAPLVTATPSGISLGALEADAVDVASVDLSDAGGGAGTWSTAFERLDLPAGSFVDVPEVVEVPGTVELAVVSGSTAGEGTGVLRLERGATVRRVPFWFLVSVPALARATPRPLGRPGAYSGDTRLGKALVRVYRYPQLPSGGAATATLAGPEQVFRVRLRRPAANFGVAVISVGRGVAVEPRVMVAGDESRLTGYPGLPVNLNPYLRTYRTPTPVAGALRPLPGAYDIVFDSRTRASAGTFTFRYWIDDVTPPAVRLGRRSVPRGVPLRARVSDAASGVDPSSVVATLDGDEVPAEVDRGVVLVPTATVRPGRHVLRLQVSDFQESRNTENVARILPNTRVVRAIVTVR
jgi:subtilisin family serine protease